eukprot:COSAG06_NODE_496_length_15043_cov_8.883565_13_plen_205_part_00
MPPRAVSLAARVWCSFKARVSVLVGASRDAPGSYCVGECIHVAFLRLHTRDSLHDSTDDDAALALLLVTRAMSATGTSGPESFSQNSNLPVGTSRRCPSSTDLPTPGCPSPHRESGRRATSSRDVALSLSHRRSSTRTTKGAGRAAGGAASCVTGRATKQSTGGGTSHRRAPAGALLPGHGHEPAETHEQTRANQSGQPRADPS